MILMFEIEDIKNYFEFSASIFYGLNPCKIGVRYRKEIPTKK